MRVIDAYHVAVRGGRAEPRWALDEAEHRDARLVWVKGRRDGSDAALSRGIQHQLKVASVEHHIGVLHERFDPAENLLSMTGQLDAELIAIGMWRRTPVSKLIPGSDSQRGVLDENYPLLTVKAES